MTTRIVSMLTGHKGSIFRLYTSCFRTVEVCWRAGETFSRKKTRTKVQLNKEITTEVTMTWWCAALWGVYRVASDVNQVIQMEKAIS